MRSTLSVDGNRMALFADPFTLVFYALMLVGFGGPPLLLVWLRRHALLTWIGLALGSIVMAAMVAWAWHDISTSTSSTAALGVLVIPPVLLVVAAATFGVDRAADSTWRLTHPTQHAPAEPTEPPPTDRAD
jgi:thiol:disulfide interchange protein